jgi:hypothetical protein
MPSLPKAIPTARAASRRYAKIGPAVTGLGIDAFQAGTEGNFSFQPKPASPTATNSGFNTDSFAL